MANIGIIGAGQIGSAFATALASNSMSSVIANSRGPESLRKLTDALSPFATAVDRHEAASKEIVLLAVPWSKIPSALDGIDFDGRILIDANNPIEAPSYQAVDLNGVPSSKIVAGYAKGARLVKAFNHLPPPLLAQEPAISGGRRVLFLAGDDKQANLTVGALIDRLGFYPIDLGTLDAGGRLTQFPGGPLPVHDFLRMGN